MNFKISPWLLVLASEITDTQEIEKPVERRPFDNEEKEKIQTTTSRGQRLCSIFLFSTDSDGEQGHGFRDTRHGGSPRFVLPDYYVCMWTRHFSRLCQSVKRTDKPNDSSLARSLAPSEEFFLHDTLHYMRGARRENSFAFGLWTRSCLWCLDSGGVNGGRGARRRGGASSSPPAPAKL